MKIKINSMGGTTDLCRFMQTLHPAFNFQIKSIPI